MFIESITAGPWQTNTYVVGGDGSGEVLVIDAGIDSYGPIGVLLEERGWVLAGVLATHGHVDHIADAARLANEAGVPVWLHGADAFMLTHPSAGIGGDAGPLMVELFGADRLPEPDELIDLADCGEVEVAGVRLAVVHAPGHSPGSVVFVATGDPVVFTGDVVFANSIGRTDLPGGDSATMMATLREVVARLPVDSRLLPGHGPTTTLAQEFASNPYLAPIRLKATR